MATGNSVFITPGVTMTGKHIFGGLALSHNPSASLAATGNAVYLGYSDAATALYGTLDLSSTTVYGGATCHDENAYIGATGTNSIHASGIAKVGGIDGYDHLYLNVSSVNSMQDAVDSASGSGKAVIISTTKVDLGSRSLTVTTADESPEGNYALVYSAAGVTAPSSVTLAGTFTQTTYAQSAVGLAEDGKLLYFTAVDSSTGSNAKTHDSSMGKTVVTVGKNREYTTIYGNFASGTGDPGAGQLATLSASDQASPKNYSLAISAGTVSGSVYGAAATGSGSTDLSATQNGAAISGGTVSGAVYGGYAKSEGTGNVEASSNSATVTGGTVSGTVYGGYALGTATAEAKNNSVAIMGGTVSGDIIGGYADPDETAVASGNTVFVTSGATVTSNYIFGGLAEGSSGASLTATDNAVYLGYSDATTALYETMDLSSTTVYGGATRYTSDASDACSEATGTNYIYVSGIVKVKAIRGYSDLVLNISPVNSMGTATDSTTGSAVAVLTSAEAVDLSSRTLTVTAESNSNLSGSNYALVYSDAGVTESSNSVTEVKATGTLTETVYENASVATSADGKLLYADLTGATSASGTSTTATKESETLPAAHLASAALVSSLNGFSAGEGLEAAVGAASSGSGLAAFGALGGSSLTYRIGSHLDVDALNASVGVARRIGMQGDTGLTLAAFLDLGTGSARSHVASASGKSDNKSFGVGLGARYRFPGGAFLDATARIGRTRADFKGEYQRTGKEAKYQSDSLYLGLSLGGGYDFAVSDRLALTPYARYCYTHVDADTTHVRLDGLTDNGLRLSSISAHTIRAGLRGDYRLNGQVTLRAGLALEHTWRGKAHSRLAGVSLATPSLSGSSGILEVGVRCTPQGVPGLSLGLGLAGRVGDVHGVAGQFRLAYAF
ncbi:MAG: autotransporter domain-containing protein [Succinivibrionaceae bacterium]|nr:autotransporter domain-containing protein [Succinivibrionaceae bacterium]